jgi:regulatory protein
MQRTQAYIDALHSLLSFCDYRERCSSEVRQKIKEYPLEEALKEALYEELKATSTFNDTRYVNAYVGGKFRIKKWGRNKIKAGLRAKQINEEMIQAGFEENIEEESYMSQLKQLYDKKWSSLKNKKDYNTRQKLQRFLYSKGYENELILALIMKDFSS